jgi:hypothetical protein
MERQAKRKRDAPYPYFYDRISHSRNGTRILLASVGGIDLPLGGAV